MAEKHQRDPGYDVLLGCLDATKETLLRGPRASDFRV